MKILSNQFFGPHLLSENYAGSHNFKFREAFKYPVRKFLSLVITPKHNIIEKVDELKNIFKGQPWASIHSRGFYDDGEGTRQVCEYTKKFLDKGTISYVLFVSESQHLINIAKSIFPHDSLVLIDKKVITRRTRRTRRQLREAVASHSRYKGNNLLGSLDLNPLPRLTDLTWPQTVQVLEVSTIQREV